MRKLLNKPWFVAVLALAAVFAVGRELLPSGGAANDDGVSWLSDDGAGTEPAAADVSGDAIDVRVALQELGAITVGRDPFAPRAKTSSHLASARDATPSPDLIDTVKLTALWMQAGETYALLNARICRAGDILGRLTLESATPDGVWLTHWKGRDFLKLGQVFTLATPVHSAADAGAATTLSISTDS
jgi:hypothetical protein